MSLTSPFAWTQRGLHTFAGFTARLGGVSQDQFESLNLGLHVGDDPIAVAQNRVLVAAACGTTTERVLYMDQVHGDTVAIANQRWDEPPTADAAVTDQPGLYLAVMVADCVPVLLSDDAAGVVGVAHAGRKGTASGVALRTVEAMKELGAQRIHATLGPSICARCYEVPERMRDEVGGQVPFTASLSRTGTASLDLAAGVAGQLVAAGVTVEIVDRCTAEHPEWFSYRRDGQTGRFAGVIGLLAEDGILTRVPHQERVVGDDRPQ